MFIFVFISTFSTSIYAVSLRGGGGCLPVRLHNINHSKIDYFEISYMI